MGKTISFVKGKGSLAHNNREFIAGNVDPERTSWNVTYVQTPLKQAYEEIFGPAVAEYNSQQKRKDRQIDNYLNKIKNSGNNEKQFYEIVVQVGRQDDTGVLDENGKLSDGAKEAAEILDQYAKTFEERNPNLKLFNAVLHMDEATPHLHLDYIPVAHEYKSGLKTRNSLTKALKEMGIEPAKGQKDNETVHWQAREREYLTEQCKERGIEIVVLGVDRDDYTIPEYKQAMREKEAAEAEVEILNSEKVEIEATIASLDTKLEAGEAEIQDQQDMLEEINFRIAEADKKIEAKEKAMDKILSAGKSVEKEIQNIKSTASDLPSLFGGEQMVKLPKRTFEKMLTKYRVAGTFEKLNEQYSRELHAKQSKIDKLTKQIGELKEKLTQLISFIDINGLVNAFEAFMAPKSVRKQLEESKRISEELDRNKGPVVARRKRGHDVAI